MKTKLRDRVLLITVYATCLVVTTNFIDPINLPKLLVLTIGTTLLLITSFFDKKKSEIFSIKSINFISSFFIFFLIISGLLSNQNLNRTLIGNYGRNNGLISYFCLIIIFLYASNYSRRNESSLVIRNFSILGAVLSLYGVIQMNRADFFHFVYGGNPIILTVGNEDFSSLLLSLTVIASIFSAIHSKSDVNRFLYSINAIFQTWIIININTAQSKLAIASSVVCFYISYIYLKMGNRRKFIQIFMGVSFISILVVFFGFKGRGPLATINSNLRNFLSRYYHWVEGWKMFKANPIHGIGLDSYGDYQPFYRVLQADGQPDSYSNNAHNIFIQLLSTGGLILASAFLLLVIFVLFRAITIFRLKNTDPELSSFFLSFCVIFLIHLVVGIDNLGLAIWFWFIAGLLVGQSYKKREQKLPSKRTLIKSVAIQSSIYSKISLTIFTSLMAVFFVFVSRESIAHLQISNKLITKNQIRVSNADSNDVYRIAMKSQDPDLRLVSVKVLYSLNAMELGLKLALDSYKISPRNLSNLDAISLYYESKKDYQNAIRYRKIMVTLDPLSSVLKQKLDDDTKLLN